MYYVISTNERDLLKVIAESGRFLPLVEMTTFNFLCASAVNNI